MQGLVRLAVTMRFYDEGKATPRHMPDRLSAGISCPRLAVLLKKDTRQKEPPIKAALLRFSYYLSCCTPSPMIRTSSGTWT